MTTPSPTEERTFLSPEQRRRLGEVYRLILSWQPADKKTEQDPQKLASLDTASSDDHSKGGVYG